MAAGTTRAEAKARSRLIAVDSYAVFLDLSGGGDTARSRTDIRFRCREPDGTTFADLDAVAVHEIVLNGTNLDGAAVANGRIVLPALAASNTLTVDATVAASGGGNGLTRYTDPADGSRYVLANCFPTAARSVFCCFDQPDLRADLSLTVTMPAGWTCVANGEPVHRPADGAAGLWRFATARAMKPYEFTLCAGPYVTAGDLPGAIGLTLRCRPGLATEPGLTRIAGIVGTALRHYEQLLDVPCPVRKLDIVFAPELGPTAMQLPAVMYVSEPLLQRAADPDDDFVAVVLAHEAAHLWFGCLVEGRWWDDLWLAEAMASYLSYTAATAVLGQPDAWAEFGLTGQASAYQADGLPGTQPVSSPVASAADALTRPTPITYAKGTSVIRQLEALIGADALRAGLHDYLDRHAWSATSLTDLMESWSRASGTDLTPWAAQWLQQPGVNGLWPDLIVGPDGVITSLAIAQSPPACAPGPLRTHRVTVGLYEPDGPRLRRTGQVGVTVRGDWTHVPELTGTPRPAALILNDADLTFAAIRLDPLSWQAVVAAAMDVGDPLAESVCWAAAFDLVQAAELDAAEFAAIVARRITSARPVAGLGELLSRAIAAADRYAAPAGRGAARQQLAAAALATAERADPGRRQRVLARGYAASADSPAQLALLLAWLGSRSLPPGLQLDLELRALGLATLAAHDLATDADLAAYAAGDPVSGASVAATCAARRPTMAAKQTAWAAALAPGQSARLARAHAEGFWVPGQEELTSEYRDRYVAEALPAIRRHDARTAQRLARALYPWTLADETTLAVTDQALAVTEAADPVRAILLEQRELLRRAIAARKSAGG